MDETSFSNLTDIVLAKSKFLLFSQVCKELGLQNDMEGLALASQLVNVQEEQAAAYNTQQIPLYLKTYLYETEDMLDNLETLREVVIKATQEKVGESGEIGNLLQWLDDPAAGLGRKRADLDQRMRTQVRPRVPYIGKQRSFVLKVICSGLLFVFVAFMLA